MNFKGFDDWFEVFKAGLHTDSAGNKRDWTEADLDQIVAQYDPQFHEAPVVVGHPKDNAPAYGWVDGLKREGSSLFAKAVQVEPQFADMVKNGLFKKRSIALNPDLSLKHIGFLGAVPPAVKGLKNIAFSADDEAVTIEFTDVKPWTWRGVAGIFRRLREMLIEQSGTEKADAVIPEYAIQDIEEAAKQTETPPEAANQYTQPHKEDRTMSEKMYTEADVTAAVNKAVEKARADLTSDFTAQTRKDKTKAEIAQFCEGLLTQGKLTPAQEKLGLMEFMCSLDTETVIEFAEGAKQTPLEFMKAFLATQPKVVEFEEVATRGKNIPASGTAGEKLEGLTKQKMAQDTSLSYAAAFSQVQVENPDLANEYQVELKGGD